jgi:hypothetical protein
MGQMRHAHEISLENLKRRDHLGELVLDERWNLRK